MEKEKQVELLHKTINGVLKAFSDSIKDGSDFTPVNAYKPENFYMGTEEFLEKNSRKAKIPRSLGGFLLFYKFISFRILP